MPIRHPLAEAAPTRAALERKRWFLRRAKDTRRTRAERRFELILRRFDIPFKAQYVLAPYVADYLLPSRNLVIEIDGGYHDAPDQHAKDAVRTQYLERVHGVRVIRFSNSTVLGAGFADYLWRVFGVRPDSRRTPVVTVAQPGKVLRRRAGVVSLVRRHPRPWKPPGGETRTPMRDHTDGNPGPITDQVRGGHRPEA